MIRFLETLTRRFREHKALRDCDASAGTHKSPDVLGQCLDCGSDVCLHCGSRAGSIVRHLSQESCFLSGRRLTIDFKYKRVFWRRDEPE